MKRFFSLCIISNLLLLLGIPISAVNFPQNSVSFVEDGHGQYFLVSSALQSMSNSDGIVVAEETSEGIYQLTNGQYLVNAYENTYQICEKVSLNTQDVFFNNEIFEIYGISDYLQNEISLIIAEQNELENNDYTIDIYAPPLSAAYNTTTTVYYRYFYSGSGTYHHMKDISVSFEGLSKNITQYNNTAYTFAHALKDIIFNTAGLVYSPVALFQYGLSAREIYENMFGTITHSSSGDYVSASIDYDKTIKETYEQCMIGLDYPNAGAITSKVWVEDLNVQQYFKAVGDTQQTRSVIEEEVFSANYKDPCPVAILNGISSTQIDDFIDYEFDEFSYTF